jgi:tetratricopeptide (TPR) repeat protein
MKRSFQLGIFGIAFAALLTSGFECASSEMTSAKLYLSRKEYSSAENQLLKEVAKNPKDEEAYYLLGQTRYYEENYIGMKDAFDSAMAIDTTHRTDINSYDVAVWGKMYNDGVEAINNAIDSAQYYDDAIKDFSIAVKVLPESAYTERNLGIAYYRKGDIAGSIPHFEIAFEKANDLISCKLLGRIFLDSAAALKAKFNDVNRDQMTLQKNLSLIHIGMMADDAKVALGDPASIVKPEKPKKRSKKKEPVKEEWQYPKYNLTLSIEDGTVKAVNYSAPFTPSIDSTYWLDAIPLYDQAIAISKRGQTLFPEDADISQNLMNAYIGAERTSEVRSLLSERIKKFPNSKYDHYNLGVFYLQDSNYVNAIAQFTASLRLDSIEEATADSAKKQVLDTTFADNAIYNIAASYVNWGVQEQQRLKAENKEEDFSYREKFKDALPYLEETVRRKKDDVQMWELLGQVYANLGQSDKAQEAYKKADEIRQSMK